MPVPERIGKATRFLVAERASHCCEYCGIHCDDTFFSCEVDHIVSRKHGGSNPPDNLAYSCVYCNRYKGSDVGSIEPETGKLTRFFNPRLDRWEDHFRLVEATITSLSAIGKVTGLIFRFNVAERIIERKELISVGAYPVQFGANNSNCH